MESGRNDEEMDLNNDDDDDLENTIVAVDSNSVDMSEPMDRTVSDSNGGKRKNRSPTVSLVKRTRIGVNQNTSHASNTPIDTTAAVQQVSDLNIGNISCANMSTLARGIIFVTCFVLGVIDQKWGN